MLTKGFWLSFLTLIFLNSELFAQKEITTFGLQFKPIVSSEIINTGPQSEQKGQIGFSIKPKQGYSFGMVIRKGISKQFSLETGINFTKRQFQLSIINDTSGFSGTSDFAYVIYEIPVLALLYVQLGEQFYMNTAFGASINFLPSDWRSSDSYFVHLSTRESWIVPSLLANVGFEYRTYDKGFFYLGFSYHRPFTPITSAGVLYQENRLEKERTFFDISGNYLTIDLRYFFHEDPEWKQKRQQR